MFAPNTKILVTDDSAAMRLMIISALKGLGFTDFEQAGNGYAGLQALKTAAASGKPVELIFSDQNMPDCTGLEFLGKVRAQPKFADIPFIVITSETAREVMMELLEAGASSVLPKPFSPESIKSKLQAVYARSRK